MRQYGRDDIEYMDWYSNWMKQLAKKHSKKELSNLYNGTSLDIKKYAVQHLRAIEKTSSMSGNSQARAQSRNNVAASGEYRIAISGAIEIHELFPEHAKREEEK